MKIKSISEIKNLEGKSILLRVDLNSNFYNKKILESDRIKAHAETIKYLISKNAKVVVMAHQGSKGKSDFVSLKQHSKILNKYVKIKFVKDVIGKKAIRAIHDLNFGEALLLDNVRFVNDEFKPGKNRFVQSLAHWFDYYVNDAFSIVHRKQTSIVSFSKILPSYAGPVLYEEYRNIEKLKSKLKNCLFILGGAKTNDVVSLFNNKKILATGKPALLTLVAHGYRLGAEEKIMKEEIMLLPRIKKNMENIMAPVDLAISVKGKRKEISIEELPTNYPILDLGEQTIEHYIEEIMEAKTIFFKGSPGLFEHKGFELGTRRILKAIADSKGFSVIAGGQSSDALNMFGINKKDFGYVSLSGGSLIKYLAGEKLPGLEALRK